MRIACLPFVTRRADARQGVLARWFPTLVLQRLAPETAPSWIAVQLRAERGADIAHVVLVTSPSVAFAKQHAAAQDATHILAGTIAATDGAIHVTWTLFAVADLDARDGDAPLLDTDADAPMVHATSLPDAILQTATALADQLGGSASVPLPTLQEPTLWSWMAELDNGALVEERGTTTALARTEDAWLPAVSVLQSVAAPEIDARLLRRILLWQQTDQPLLATRAALARAKALQDGDAWALAARLAAYSDEPALLDAALLGWVDAAPTDTEAALRLGVRHLQNAREDDAVVLLEFAATSATFGPLATAYLGVALAATGDLPRAIACWQQAANSNHPVAIRIAQTNLHRADAIDDGPPTPQAIASR